MPLQQKQGAAAATIQVREAPVRVALEDQQHRQGRACEERRDFGLCAGVGSFVLHLLGPKHDFYESLPGEFPTGDQLSHRVPS